MSVVQLNPRISILQRTWGDESVVYVIDTGETHLLTAVAAGVIESLRSGPLPPSAIAALLNADTEDDDLTELLDGLCRVGLIELAEQSS